MKMRSLAFAGVVTAMLAPGSAFAQGAPVRVIDGTEYLDYVDPRGAHFDLPLEIPYDPAIGLPGGYEVVGRPSRRALMGAGIPLVALWGVSWVAGGTAVNGNPQNSGPLVMFAPVVGPFIGIEVWGSNNLGVQTLLFMDGLAQAVFAAILIKEIAAPSKIGKLDPALKSWKGLKIRPMATGGPGAGLVGLSGAF